MLKKEIAKFKGSPEELKKFGITVGTVLMLLGLAFWFYDKNYAWIVFLAGMTLLVLGLLKLRVLRPIYRFWMTCAIILGWFMTRVILSLFFFLVLTPIALVARGFGNHFLELKWDKSLKSYWHYRSENEKSSYETQF